MELKRKRPSKLKIVRMSLCYFAALSKRKPAIVFLVIILAVAKNFLKFKQDEIRSELNKSNASLDLVFVNFVLIAIYNTSWSSINFLTDFVFEKYLTPYGGILTIKILNNIFKSNNKDLYDLSGSSLEYLVTEGAKSMAKISRFILFSLVSRMLHHASGMTLLAKEDKSSFYMVTLLVEASIFLMAFFQCWQVVKVSKYNKVCMKISHDKEASINENLENVAIIKSYSMEDHCLYKYNRIAYKWEEANISTKFWIFSSDMIYSLLSCTFRPGLTVLLIAMDKNNSLNAAQIRNYLTNLTESYITMEATIRILRELFQSLAIAEDIIEYIELNDGRDNDKVKVETFCNDIKAEHLHYSIKGKVVITDASFTIKKGDKCVIYGRNGTGKSSIAKLLLGFDDYQGSILFDGVEFKRLSMDDYRKIVTYVPQDTRLFNETIYYNLAFGNDRPFAEIVEMSKKMKIHDTIMMFPEGYNTCVGEFGKNINGGLRQKIFYTRALLCNTEIFIFDEPTNNLDEAHSQFVTEIIQDPAYCKTTFVVICHDIDIVNKFPTIFKFKDGKILLEKSSSSGSLLIKG